jgi:hypothetical protein
MKPVKPRVLLKLGQPVEVVSVIRKLLNAIVVRLLLKDEGIDSIASKAVRIRRWSAAGIRLSAFLAGPARSSSHFIAEFVQGYKVATGDRGSTSANRAQFSGDRDFLRNSVREVGAQRLTHEFGPGAVFVLPHSFQLLEHGWRQRNGKRRSGSGHGDTTKYDLIIPASVKRRPDRSSARSGCASSISRPPEIVARLK